MVHGTRWAAAFLAALLLLAGCAAPGRRAASTRAGAAGRGLAAYDGQYVGTWTDSGNGACGDRSGTGSEQTSLVVIDGRVGIPTRSGDVVPANIEPGGVVRTYDPHSMSWITGQIRDNRLQVRMSSTAGGRACVTSYAADRVVRGKAAPAAVVPPQNPPGASR